MQRIRENDPTATWLDLLVERNADCGFLLSVLDAVKAVLHPEEQARVDAIRATLKVKNPHVERP